MTVETGTEPKTGTGKVMRDFLRPLDVKMLSNDHE
jgi:hypothetical protein